ncbi:MAG: homoprotocatechuate degradation operon regulator HpaR [Methylobacteriaceae bacterium]|nr:homoprotocatechuate degradation operon regulator HpaR [Methylobacteriaceae bacterium]
MNDTRATAEAAQLRHFSASLPMLLLRAREAVMVRFRAMLKAQGVTEQQWRVLRALATRPTFEIPELVAATFLLAPSLSRILADLEAAGLIVVGPHKTDQRRKVIRLAERGAQLIAETAPLSEAIYADISARIGAERLDALQRLLEEVEDALQTGDAVPAPAALDKTDPGA